MLVRIKNSINPLKDLDERGFKSICHFKDDVYYCESTSNNIKMDNVEVLKKDNNHGKMSFRYGAMGSSKTANLLMVAFNYEEKGRKAIIVKSGVDTRDGELIIKSRIGLSRECITIESLMDMPIEQIVNYDAILCDEVQFATEEQVNFLASLADYAGITVICFGLRADFQGHLFPGSKRLFEIADEFVELKTICWCGRKATFNCRYNENGIVREGEQVQLGANDSYISVCRHHFNTGELWPDKKSNNQDD